MKALPLTWLESALREAALEQANPKPEVPRIIVMRLCKDGVSRPANAKPRKTIERAIEEFWSKVERGGPDECWRWIGKRCGKHRIYGQIMVLGRNVLVHRFSYVLAFGDPGERLVCHECDNPVCVNPRHFFTGTDKTNTEDRMNKGRRAPPRGEDHNKAKLTEVEAGEIHEYFKAHGKPRGVISEMARRYKVSRGAIQQIYKRKSWKHITAGVTKARLHP